MAAHRNLAQQLYVAYYGRPADPAGLNYWADRFDAEGDALTEALNAFGTSAEYTTSIIGVGDAELTSEQLVQRLYLQLFGRDAEAEGLEMYVDRLADGSATLANIAKQIADGAMGDDATVLANKVAVANTFTSVAAGTAGFEYEASDIAAAQAVLAAVGATATLAAGHAAALAAVADLVEFDLAAAVDGLATANDNKAGFLLAAKAGAIANEAPLELLGDTIDPKTALLEGTLAKLEAGAAAQLGVLLGDDPRAATGAPGENTPFSDATPAVRAALLADGRAANAKTLAGLEKTQATAQAAVDKVAGLASAIAVKSAATAADTAADKVVVTANAEVTGAVAVYNSLNADNADIAESGIDNDKEGAATPAVVDGTLADLIVADDTTQVLGLMKGITETTNPGITDLLAAINTREAAEKAAAGTQLALDTATTTVNDLDLNTAGVTALETLGAGFRTPIGLDFKPTRGQITKEVADLATAETAADGAKTAADKVVTDANNDGGTASDEQTGAATMAATAAAAAAAAVTKFSALLVTYEAASSTIEVVEVVADPSASPPVLAVEAVPPGDPLAAALAAAAGMVVGQKAKDVLIDKAVAGLALVQSGVDALAVFNNAIAAAEKVFTDADLKAPDTLTATTFATTGDDIFLVDAKGPTAINLSLFSSDDTLVIGDDYLRNTGDVADDGDDAVLEYFLDGSKDGAPVWTQVTLETSAFGSNAGEPEVIEITLVGVALGTVDVTDGFLTIG